MVALVTPAVQRLMDVDHRPMAEWISSIPFEEWPQQTRLADGKIRPAMVNDLRWRGFDQARSGPATKIGTSSELALALALMEGGIGVRGGNVRLTGFMLSVVMPGHSIDPHRDEQIPGWLTRVHVPLLTNPWAFFDVHDDGNRRYQMEAGRAYLVDVMRRHAVSNNGQTPRVHFMFDVFTQR